MQPGTPTEHESANFAFLREHDPLFLRLCAAAERYSVSDPNAAVVKLRQFGEALVRHDFTERNIASAWKQARNQDIAATLIGYIRQLALGSPLLPLDQRVDRGLARLLASRAWTEPQRRWLERIATTVKSSWVVDATTFTQGAWVAQGGMHTLNRVFDGQALQVAQDLEDAVWEDAA